MTRNLAALPCLVITVEMWLCMELELHTGPNCIMNGYQVSLIAGVIFLIAFTVRQVTFCDISHVPPREDTVNNVFVGIWNWEAPVAVLETVTQLLRLSPVSVSLLADTRCVGVCCYPCLLSLWSCRLAHV